MSTSISFQELTAVTRSKITLGILPKERYQDLRPLIISRLAQLQNKICYITVNRPYKTIVEELETQRLRGDRISFLDATPGEKKSSSEYVAVASPTHLTELSLAISKQIEEGFDLAVFDSIDTLALYNEWKVAIKFLHLIINKIRASQSRALFLAIVSHDTSEIAKDLYMLVDSVLNLSELVKAEPRQFFAS